MTENKKIIGAAAEMLDLKYDQGRSIAYGMHRNFMLIISRGASSNRQSVDISLCVSFQGNPIHSEYLQGVRLPDKVSCYADRFRINMTFYVEESHEENVNRITEAVRVIIDFVSAHGGMNCDEKGVSGETAVFFAQGKYVFLGEESAGPLYTSIISTSANRKAVGENYIMGTLGAILGSAAGALLIVLLARLGKIALLSGVVMGLATVFSYKKFAGGFSKISVVICTLVSAAMAYLTFCLNSAVELYKAFQNVPTYDDATFGYCFTHIREMYIYADSLNAYSKNLISMMTIWVIGIIVAVWIAYCGKEEEFEIYRLE